MGKVRYKVKVKTGPKKKKITRKITISGYVGDAGYDAYKKLNAEKARVDSLQIKLDSLQHKIDSMSAARGDILQVQMQAKWGGKK